MTFRAHASKTHLCLVKALVLEAEVPGVGGHLRFCLHKSYLYHIIFSACLKILEFSQHFEKLFQVVVKPYSLKTFAEKIENLPLILVFHNRKVKFSFLEGAPKFQFVHFCDSSMKMEMFEMNSRIHRFN